MRNVLFAALAGTALAASASVSAQPYNLTIAGYSPGGLVSTVGSGLDAALNAAFPGSTLTYQTGSGGLANAVLLDQGRVPLGFVADTELQVAIKGREPINRPLESLRILFRPYTPGARFQMTHVLVNKSWADRHGITTLAELGAKKPPIRIAANRPGNLDGDVGLAALAAVGLMPADIERNGQLVRAASVEMTSLMLDRRLDGVVFGISYNHPRIQEMANGLDLVMLPMEEQQARKVIDELGGGPCTIKAEEYDFLAKDSASVCVGMSVVATTDMSEELAYNITKGVFENIDRLQGAHRLLQQAVTPQTLAEPGGAPFHPGAEKYLREAGLLN